MGFLIVKEIDKANHFITGYLIYFLSSFFLPWYSCILLVASIGALKEVYDSIKSGNAFDVPDFIYTIVGCIPSFIIHIL
jgi:hypothetical protein